MQRLFASMAFALLTVTGFASTASAEKIDLSTVSCSQLIQSVESGSEKDKSGMGGILYWIAGFTVTDEQGAVIDFGGLSKDFDKILAACKEQPKVGVLTVASKFLGANATPHGKDAVDLATLTCEAAVKSSQEEEEGLGYILMWIAGYQASDSGNKIFDTDTFEADMHKIGEYCGTNPAVGLITASDEIMGEDDESSE
ncbi:HdeA/HdeB family chaperone [Hyphomicrobium sp.]|uniref:HdeA/HdeB family chaperone n=1 Tax=Hyphomicrobium sp. TaxID=82 RepID=UPI002E321D28|nr:HdeA/HdeB family chaperone [Hyphomicrobium sp.]HEX2843383.1 HdeA/HdeB family chaperone [Hyphomicrobium sp.]